MNTVRRGNAPTYVILVMGVGILVLSAVGFGMKFLELVQAVLKGGDGAFAISPVVNYLLASLGFLCLLGWAVAHGMFRNVERPKETMLEDQQRLDAQLSSDRLSDSDKQEAPTAFFDASFHADAG